MIQLLIAQLLDVFRTTASLVVNIDPDYQSDRLELDAHPFLMIQLLIAQLLDVFSTIVASLVVTIDWSSLMFSILLSRSATTASYAFELDAHPFQLKEFGKTLQSLFKSEALVAIFGSSSYLSSSLSEKLSPSESTNNGSVL